MQLLSTLLLVGLASASASLHDLAGQPRGFLLGRGLEERQDTCQRTEGGTTCQAYCGPQWRSCATDDYCYNPDIHVCCSNGWHCDKGNYCVDGNGCCPNGDTLEQCGATVSVGTIGEPAATEPPSESTPQAQSPTVMTTATPITSAAPNTPVTSNPPNTPKPPASHTTIATVVTTEAPIVTAGAVGKNVEHGALAAAGGIAALFLAL